MQCMLLLLRATIAMWERFKQNMNYFQRLYLHGDILSLPYQLPSSLPWPHLRQKEKKRRQDWENSFCELYYMLRNNLCSIFYVYTSEFMALFVGGCSLYHASLSR